MPNEERTREEALDDEVVRGLGQEVLRLSRRKVVLPPGAQLDQSAYRILWVLSESGPLSMVALRELLQLEQSTISRQVAAATRQGLVAQRLVAGTKRHKVVPTPEGLEAYRKEGAVRGELFRKAIDVLGIDRALVLTGELRALNDAMDEAMTSSAKEAQLES